MFQTIVQSFVQNKYDQWARGCVRYKILDAYDRLLDGTFYDHLPWSFYDETDGQGKYNPIRERRPSSQFRLPRMVGRQVARKLFAGRHRPRIRHKDDATAIEFRKMMRSANLLQIMSDVVLMGQVGAVALTFRVDEVDEQKRVSFSLWRAKYCWPEFDKANTLAKLRVNYITDGAHLKAMKGAGRLELDDGAAYWFIRDYMPEAELTYLPVKKDEWNPIDGFTTDPNRTLQLWDEETTAHDLGFVPGVWFRNLPGGLQPDGACTFEDAIPNLIELDYTMSQLGRGVRYNAAPQTVVIGEYSGAADSRTGDPSTIMHLRGGRKDEDGNTDMSGDAKLLEMAGTGIDASLKFVEELRNLALEQICASRKDPEKMKGPLSGRAMEYLDEDFADLVMDFRTIYGDNGLVPLMRLIARAMEMDADLGSLSLQWPRLFQPTANELGQVIPALVQAVYPGVEKIGPTSVASPVGEGAAPPPPPEKTLPGLLTLEQASQWLKLNMDIDMVEDEAETPEEQDLIEPDTPEPMHGPPPIDAPPDEPAPPTDAEAAAIAAAAHGDQHPVYGSPMHIDV